MLPTLDCDPRPRLLRGTKLTSGSLPLGAISGPCDLAKRLLMFSGLKARAAFNPVASPTSR